MKKITYTLLLAVMVTALFMPALAETATTTYTFDLTPIVEGLIGILATLVTAFLIPWIKSKTTAQQQEFMMAVIQTLVRAAEQRYGSGEGKAKLEYVQKQLLARGIKIDLDAIEAAVRALSIEGGEAASTETATSTTG